MGILLNILYNFNETNNNNTDHMFTSFFNYFLLRWFKFQGLPITHLLIKLWTCLL